MTTSTPPQPDTADRLKNSTTCVDVNSLIIASVSSAYRLSFESTRLPDYSEWSVTDMIEAVAEGVRQAFREIASSGGQFDLPHELLFDAVRRGTCAAIWQMITNATQAPCADFYATVKEGVRDGIVRIADDRAATPPSD